MLVRRAQSADLNQLAVLFDEYRQFYGTSSNPELSYQFLKQRFEDGQTVIFINTKDDTFTGFIILYLGFSSVACSTAIPAVKPCTIVDSRIVKATIAQSWASLVNSACDPA